MSILLTILGLLQIAAGIFFIGAAKGGIHETTAVVAFGMGVLAIGIGHVIKCLEDQSAAAQTPTPQDAGRDGLITTYKKYDIRRSGLFVKAGGQIFDNVDAAKRYIDNLEQQ